MLPYPNDYQLIVDISVDVIFELNQPIKLKEEKNIVVYTYHMLPNMYTIVDSNYSYS